METYLDDHYIEMNFKKLSVPKDSAEKIGTFMYGSKNYDKKQTLMLIIVPKAGVWFNWSYNAALNTQVPYLKRAAEKKYGVIITNMTDLWIYGKQIPDCGTPEEYCLCVWNQYVAKTRASSIVIVTNRAPYMIFLSQNVRNDFEKRVAAIVILSDNYEKYAVTTHVRRVAKTWVEKKGCSFNTPLVTSKGLIKQICSGSKNCLETPSLVMDLVFEFIENKLIKFYLKHPYIEDNNYCSNKCPRRKNKSLNKTTSFNIVRDHINDLIWMNAEEIICE